MVWLPLAGGGLSGWTHLVGGLGLELVEDFQRLLLGREGSHLGDWIWDDVWVGEVLVVSSVRSLKFWLSRDKPRREVS